MQSPAAVPLISVIVPTRDRCRLLPATLESALDQTLGEIEVIVVDDGSTDTTAADVEAVRRRDPRVLYVYQEHQGPSVARNTGLRLARADWIAFLDDDDLWLPDALRVLFDAARDVPHAVACRCLRFFSDEPVRATDVLANRAGYRAGPWPERPPRSPVTLSALLLEPQIPILSALYRRAVLEELGGFDPQLWAAEDYELWLRLAARCPVTVLPQALGLYRWHPSQLRKATRKMSRGTRRAIESFVAAHPDAIAMVGADRLRRRRAALLQEEAYAALLERRGGEARACALESIRLSPARVKIWIYWMLSAAPGLFHALRRLRRGA